MRGCQLVRMSVGLGMILVLVILGALAIVIPVVRLPHPTGPRAIGTLTYHWVDASRADIFTVDPNTRRELMVQVWYPADAGASPTHAPYMQDADAVMAAFARIHGKPRSSSVGSSTSRPMRLRPRAWPTAKRAIRF